MRDPLLLTLPEEVLLLALNDEKGTVHFGASFAQAAGGALLAELLLRGRLGVEGEKKKARVVVRDARPLDDPLLDDALTRVADDGKRRSPAHWVQNFAGLKHLKGRLARRLVDHGVLKEEEDRILLLFHRTVYPEADHRPEREIIRRLRGAILATTSRIEPRTVVLLALAKHAGLLKHVLDKDRLKQRKQRIDRLIAGEIAGQATREAVQAMQAAVMVAVMVPAITASTTAT
jgi:hypothetical protein